MIARLRALPLVETLALVAAFALLVALGVLQQQTAGSPAAASYSTYDANPGGARAFYELLAREGENVDRFERQAAFLDESIDTLVWIEPLPADPRQTIPTAADVATLEAWVRGGGRFLYAGFDDAAAKSGILNLPSTRRASLGSDRPRIDPALRAVGVADVTATPDFSERWQPRPGMRVLVTDARGPLVVRYAFGRGVVTAVVDEALFSNANIGAGDRARLLVALARPGRSGGTIAVDEYPHGHAAPAHWWEVLPRALVVAIVVAALALAFAIAGAAVRFGPPLIPRPRDDASSREFIAALAGLLASGRATRSAMTAAADSTSRSLARAAGLRDGAQAEEIAARLDDVAERRDFATMLAIANNGFPDDRNLVRAVALAQRLRKDHRAHVDRSR